MTIEKTYSITPERCKEMIHGVCKQCGGELEPIETVDNAGTPTYWAGCNTCEIFCWGVTPEVFAIATMIVDERHYVAYHSMESPYGKDDEYKKYYRESQVSGACSIVMDVLNAQKKYQQSLTPTSTTPE